MIEQVARKEILFCEYFQKWIEFYKVGNIRDVTLYKYYATLQRLKEIAPELKLAELDRAVYQNIINAYAETHEKTTTTDFHHQLRACIRDAVADRDIEVDPSNRVIMKGKEPKEKKPKFLSQFEAQCLVRSLDLGDKINLDYLVLILIKTGLRYAEALALTPNDFDFANQTITVNKTWWYKEAGNGKFMPTKNASSVRTIQVDMQTLFKFSNLIKDLPSDKPIFLTNRRTGNLHNSTANEFLEKKCKEAGITCTSIHGLRHTHASILIANGVSVASVAKRLGHSNTMTTQKVYLHLIQELENKDNALVLASMMNL